MLFVGSLLINVGMWMERFNNVVSSTAQSYDPNMWRMYTPTLIELGILAGSAGCFAFLFLLTFLAVILFLNSLFFLIRFFIVGVHRLRALAFF